MTKIVFIIILSCLGFLYTMKAQQPTCDTPGYICTPNGSVVHAAIQNDNPLHVRQQQDITFMMGYPNAQVLYYVHGSTNPSSSLTYNCHGYAWIYEGYSSLNKITRWHEVNPPEYGVMNYINDGSYVEVTRKLPNAKVLWYPNSHSAVISANDTNKLISKWDFGPLVMHDWNDCPSCGSNPVRKYYANPSDIPVYGPETVCNSAVYTMPITSGSISYVQIPPGFSVSISGTTITVNVLSQPSNVSGYFYFTLNGKQVQPKFIRAACIDISGPPIICVGTSHNYTVTNAAQGYTWSCSANVTKNGSGNPQSFTGSSTGTGWIAIKDASGNELKRMTVYVVSSSWNPWNIVGSPYLYSTSGSREDYYINPTINASWSLAPVTNDVLLFNWNGTSSSAYLLNVSGVGGNTYTLKATIPTAGGCICEVTKNIAIRQMSPSPIIVYPNPVSDILHIEIDKNAILRANNEGNNINLTFDIRLYNSTGTLQRQTATKNDKLQINVSGLSDGIYYLHVYDGISSKPEILTLIVKH